MEPKGYDNTTDPDWARFTYRSRKHVGYDKRAVTFMEDKKNCLRDAALGIPRAQQFMADYVAWRMNRGDA